MLDKKSCFVVVEKYYDLPFGNCSTEQGRKNALAKMRSANEIFYQLAVQTGCHPFIEFCGIMHTYIQICQELDSRGIDFSQINVHTGQKAQVPQHSIAYLKEKLECIFSGFEINPFVKD